MDGWMVDGCRYVCMYVCMYVYMYVHTQEHAVAPFFVFQVLCVLLWSLDENWYYSLFTLILLVIFESTVCYQRQKSMEMLRSMRRPAYPVWAYRESKWQEILSEDLLPGMYVRM